MNLRNIRRLALGAALALIASDAAPAQTLTLDEAIRSALQKNERIGQYEERLEQKEYGNKEAWGNFLPSLNFTASYTHLNDPIKIDLEPVRQAMMTLQAGTQTEFANVYNLLQGKPALTPAQRAAVTEANFKGLDQKLPLFVEQVKAQDYKTGTFVATQPLFLGGKLLAAKRYASSELRSAEYDLQKTRNEIVQETVTNYLAVVLLTEVVATREEVLAGMTRHETQAKKLFAEGLIANHQVMRAEVAVADAERNLMDDSNRLELARIALRASIGMQPDEPVTVMESLSYRKTDDTLSTYEAGAMTHHPILLMLAEKREAAAQNYNVQRSEFLPQIAAFGKYEVYPQYLSILEPRWAVGVQLSVNLFSGFKKYSKLESAVHLEREVEHLEADTKRKIDLLVNKNYRELTNARSRYIRLRKNIRLAEENLRLMQNRFETGLGTSLDVIDAQLVLEKNRIESKTSLFEYYKAMTELYAAVGEPEKVLTIWNAKGEEQ
ncbi:MAG TPA: TolC family protein [Bacteroidota bacterium]|nr:TolC family protein [Bacteroidota bacterium]